MPEHRFYWLSWYERPARANTSFNDLVINWAVTPLSARVILIRLCCKCAHLVFQIFALLHRDRLRAQVG